MSKKLKTGTTFSLLAVGFLASGLLLDSKFDLPHGNAEILNKDNLITNTGKKLEIGYPEKQYVMLNNMNVMLEIQPEKDITKEGLINIADSQLYINYMIDMFGVEQKRAKLLLDLIEKYKGDFTTEDLLALAAIESGFKNDYAELYPIEDSMGYFQMKSDTIAFMKKLNPELPSIKSQKEFQLSVEAQVEYATTYLHYIKELKGNNVQDILSAYNRGHNSKKFNYDYVIRHHQALEFLKKYMQKNKIQYVKHA